MQLTSFRGVTFTTLGVTIPSFAAPESPSASRSPAVIDRIGADPLVTGIEVGARVMTVMFTPANGQTVEPTFAKILALLNPDDPVPATLVGSFLKTGPSTFVTVEATAICGSYRYAGVTSLLVDFIIQSPWREQSATTLLSATTYTADGSFPNLNTGFRDSLPVLTIGALGRGATKTADYGYERKIELTITNSSTAPLVNYPYQIGPLDTALLVTTSFMLASGNDLRVFCEGVEWPRNLIGANTERSFIWFVIPWLAPLQSIVVSLEMDNASAGSPPTLTLSSDPLRPAIDLTGTGYTGNNGSTTTTVTVTGAGWETDQWQGGTVITGISGAGSNQMRRLASNTATVATVTRAWTAPGATIDMTVIKSGLMGDGGTASAGGAATLTDAAQTWRINEWIGATVVTTGGTGSGQTRTVQSNTPTALTVTANWTTNPDATTTYNVYRHNGIWMWDVRQPPNKTTSYPGLWQANKIQAPPTQVTWDSPGSWYRFAYARSNDAYSQPRYDSFLVGAGDYDHVPIMNIQRARRGKSGSQKEVGIADAIGVSSPVPINGIFFGYTLRNAKKAGSGSPGEGMAEARFMVQEVGGETWSTFLSDVAVKTATTTVTPIWYDLTGYGSPNRVAMALIPNASDEIPDADNNTAQLRSIGNHVSLSVNPTSTINTPDWVAAGPATVACYDVYLILRTGGAGSTKPYERLVIGASGHRLFLQFTGGSFTEQLKIDCETHIISLVDSAGVFVRRIPYAVQVQDVVADPEGNTETLVGSRWLPVPSSAVDAAAIYFSDPSGASWGNVRIAATGKLGYLT